MKQATLNLSLNSKKTRKEVFLEQMEQVVSWAELVELAYFSDRGRRFSAIVDAQGCAQARN